MGQLCVPIRKGCATFLLFSSFIIILITSPKNTFPHSQTPSSLNTHLYNMATLRKYGVDRGNSPHQSTFKPCSHAPIPYRNALGKLKFIRPKRSQQLLPLFLDTFLFLNTRGQSKLTDIPLTIHPNVASVIEIAAKLAAKYDVGREAQVRNDKKKNRHEGLCRCDHRV